MVKKPPSIRLSLTTTFLVACTSQTPLSAEPIALGEKASLEVKVENTKTLVMFSEEVPSQSTVFEVPDPKRVVIDISNLSVKPLPKPIKKSSPCLTGIRFGRHDHAFRIVLDVADPACSFGELREKGRLTVTLEKLASLQPVQTTTYAAVPTATPTSSPTAAPTKTPTATTTPTITATATTMPTATAIPPSITPATAAPLGKILKGITYTHEKDQPIIKLELSERMNFKLTRDSDRQYRISINDCSLENTGLSLPQFPPNDMAGFTLIQASPGEGKLDVIIGLDDGMKAFAYNTENSIVIKAEPAGF